MQPAPQRAGGSEGEQALERLRPPAHGPTPLPGPTAAPSAVQSTPSAMARRLPRQCGREATMRECPRKQREAQQPPPGPSTAHMTDSHPLYPLRPGNPAVRADSPSRPETRGIKKTPSGFREASYQLNKLVSTHFYRGQLLLQNRIPDRSEEAATHHVRKSPTGGAVKRTGPGYAARS